MGRLNLACDAGSLTVFEPGFEGVPNEVDFVEIQLEDFELSTDPGLTLSVIVNREEEGETSGEIIAHLEMPQIIYLRNYLNAFLQIQSLEKGPASEDAQS
ncbi:hypothetical protein BWI93_08650 [Siphonobacter sp. BAB-5385]|uniref:hypothetical protein n=1 Tax=unclassified Siphonobacter TaxID=2635712 RepID=UPI000B9DD517|nr:MULTISPECIES: hypothetical protein [unclassified Siphonobacter]OZI08460.1 hypothetical protein BWI93_08650 [Siphonobacter sp. BAB-5385]PMD99151.1 hypothetical protein BWI97_01725 [Siphonobacter sp. BAB-5405]